MSNKQTMTDECISSELKRQLSIKLSNTLNGYGYSTRRRAARIAVWDKWSEANTVSARQILKNDEIDIVCVGSLREGIGLLQESDLDIMQIYNNIQCLSAQNEELTNNKVTFKIDSKSTPPGYAFLCLVENTELNCDYFEKIEFKEKNGQKYLSNESYMVFNKDVYLNKNIDISKRTVYMQRNGPSIPLISTQKSFLKKLIYILLSIDFNKDMDFVRAFPCSCPDLLEAWCKRPRTHDWPSQATIQQVSESHTYVVPVGETGTEDEHLQWRISFIHAEMCLVRSFNDTQAKVLILLRHIAKHLLTPICEDITSYVIKNVMFWLAEDIPTDMFQEQHFIERLEDGLQFIRNSIEKKNLPNFMIPGRNLFQGKLTNNYEGLLQNLDMILYQCANYINGVMNCRDISEYPEFFKVFTYICICKFVDSIEPYKLSQLKIKQLADYITYTSHATSPFKIKLYCFYHMPTLLPFKYMLAILKEILIFLKVFYPSFLPVLKSTIKTMWKNSALGFTSNTQQICTSSLDRNKIQVLYEGTWKVHCKSTDTYEVLEMVLFQNINNESCTQNNTISSISYSKNRNSRHTHGKMKKRQAKSKRRHNLEGNQNLQCRQKVFMHVKSRTPFFENLFLDICWLFLSIIFLLIVSLGLSQIVMDFILFYE